MTPVPLQPRVRRFAITVLVLAVVLVLLAPSARALAKLWLDTGETTYTHGFLVAAISLWMLWSRRVDPAAKLPLPYPLVAAAMLGAALLWELCYLAGIQLACLVLLPFLAWCGVFLAQGPAVARSAAFPLAYLYFAVPVWDYLNGTAQSVTVVVVRALLRWTDVPAFVSGNLVQIRGGVFQIAGGCSGLHFIIVGLALAALLGEVRGDRWRMRVRWLLIALALAVVTNWIRVYTIILAGHLTNMQHYIVRVSHYGYGWLLFAVAVLMLFLIERRVALPPKPSAALEMAARLAPRAAWLTGLLIAALPFLLNLSLPSPDGRPEVARHAAAPPPPAGWTAVDGESAWKPVQVGADRLVRQRYRRDHDEVELLVASYAALAQGRELGGFENRPGGDAEVRDTSWRAVGERGVRELHIVDGGGDALVWVQYSVEGRPFTSALRAQLWYSWRTLTRLRPAPSAVLLLRAACAPDCGTAVETMSVFWKGVGDPR